MDEDERESVSHFVELSEQSPSKLAESPSSISLLQTSDQQEVDQAQFQPDEIELQHFDQRGNPALDEPAVEQLIDMPLRKAELSTFEQPATSPRGYSEATSTDTPARLPLDFPSKNAGESVGIASGTRCTHTKASTAKAPPRAVNKKPSASLHTMGFSSDQVAAISCIPAFYRNTFNSIF